MHTILWFKKHVAKSLSSKTNFRANKLENQSEWGKKPEELIQILDNYYTSLETKSKLRMGSFSVKKAEPGSFEW